MAKLLEMKDICKSFSGTQILFDVNFDLEAGQVHALVGENGAGKSTLIKTLAGVHRPDSGSILIDEREVALKTPKDAFDSGVSTIHQEFNLVPFLDVAANIFLGNENATGGVLNKKEMYDRTQELLDRVGADIKPNTLVKKLGVAEKQMVEICKALSIHSKIIIMDEPTAVLSSKEIDKLFAVIESVKAQGISVIYISHRLEELPRIADRVSVLRDGHMIGEVEGEFTKEKITKMMIGRDLTEQFPNVERELGGVVLKVDHLNSGAFLKDISFELRAGEILGFSGLVGAGRTEMARAIMGLDKKDSGDIYLNGEKVELKSALSAKKRGVVMVPEERKSEGLVLTMSVKENVSLTYLPSFAKGPAISGKEVDDRADDVIDRLSIRPADRNIKTVNMSGGNQQKVAIGKWIYKDHSVMIFDEPTRGVDVGAKAEIYKIIAGIAKKGVGIIMISSDLPEIIGMSDRVIVMKEGRISGELKKDVLSEHAVMQLAF